MRDQETKDTCQEGTYYHFLVYF